MSFRNTAQGYGFLARVLHWTMALLIIGMLVVGLVMTGMPPGPDKFEIYGLHKATGMLVLFLFILRFGWRLASIIPPLPEKTARWQKFAANGTHYALYGLMLLTPFSGWMMSSAAGYPVSFYGLFEMPRVISANKELREIMGEVHELGAYTIMALLVGHIGAALLHHFYYKDNILRRMWRGQ